MPNIHFAPGTTGNLANAVSVPAGTTSAPVALDLSAVYEGELTAQVAFGSLGGVNGAFVLLSDVTVAGTATGPFLTQHIPAVSNQTQEGLAIHLPTGKYAVKVQNTDNVNAITFTLTKSMIDAVI